MSEEVKYNEHFESDRILIAAVESCSVKFKSTKEMTNPKIPIEDCHFKIRKR